MADVKKIATRDSYGNALKELGAEHDDLIVFDADLAGATKTGTFQKAFPERHFDCGIAEGNMMAVAAGAAAMGLVPFASSFAMFAAGRAFEQVRNSIGYPRIYHCFTDSKSMVKAAYEHVGPVYMRFGRSGVPVFHDGENFQFQIGKGEVLTEGNDVAIIANGLLVAEALEAAKTLKEEGISARVINMATIKPLDEELVLKAAKECGKVITCEEHNILGGLGEAVCGVLSEKLPTPVRRIGVNDEFGHSGPAGALLKQFGLSAEHIVEVAKSF